MKLASIVIRLRSRGGTIVHDLLMIPAAWLGALWLRFNLDSIPAEFLDQALRVLPVMVVIQSLSFLYFGLYRGVWRFASMPDIVRIFRAVLIGVSLCVFVTFVMTRMTYIPRSSFPLFMGLLLTFLIGPRFLYRWFKDRRVHGPVSKKALIVGAGRGGEMLARALLRDPSCGYRPIGFIDDDPEKKGRDIHGVRVLDHCRRIPEITARTGADVIVIAMPSASAAQMRRIVELCERSGVSMRAIPYMGDLVSGRAVVSELRAVTIENLLDRVPVRFDWPGIRHELTARTVVVTGGGGSIGSELCRQVACLDPSRLVVVDVNESGLHRTEAELRDAYPALPLSIVLADICDAAAVKCIFRRYAPDIVFHAAAYKHVPMLESHMREAVRVNGLGTQTMVDAAAEHATGLFVLVSSDKAVNPANAMGASKRLAEMVCRAAGDASPSSRFITVRFGNVLDSAGSVVPLFREQIARGGPVTVTDPDMERYFMTIPEACQLIMASTALGKGGDVFVLDMGEPMRIVYLAEQMIRLSGKVPGKDIAIEFIGSRPGEKLSEELIHPGESPGLTRCHEKILLVHSPSVEQAWFAPRLAKLRDACDAFDEPALRRILSELVPEYFRPPSAEETRRTTATSPRRDTSSTAAPRAR